MDKSLVERSLKLILGKSPDIGEYDDMSQVLMFTKPDEVTSLIDELLDKYNKLDKGEGKI
jgi:hypothetical protein